MPCSNCDGNDRQSCLDCLEDACIECAQQCELCDYLVCDGCVMICVECQGYFCEECLKAHSCE